jgi:homoserine O-acetyltransferase
VFFAIASSGGTLAYQKMAPTREKANKLLDERLAAPFTADANDYLYQWEASGDYDASPGLAHITAALLAINSADDEGNPPETGLLEGALKQIKNGRLYLIPASEETRGHGTTGEILPAAIARIAAARAGRSEVARSAGMMSSIDKFSRRDG